MIPPSTLVGAGSALDAVDLGDERICKDTFPFLGAVNEAVSGPDLVIMVVFAGAEVLPHLPIHGLLRLLAHPWSTSHCHEWGHKRSRLNVPGTIPFSRALDNPPTISSWIGGLKGIQVVLVQKPDRCVIPA